MKNKRFHVIAFVVLTMVVLVSGVSAQSFALVQEQENTGVDKPQSESLLSIATHVSWRFSYQGVLEENGSPVTGPRDMSFNLYSDDGCASFWLGSFDTYNVPVENGLFSVQLDFDPDKFTGQALFLLVDVEDTVIACQEITPVPYALSLRPGAIIANESTQDNVAAVTGEVSSTSPGSYSTGLRGINKGTGGTGIGVYGSQDGGGWGVFGQVDGNGRGVYGYAEGDTGIGVYGASIGTNGVGVHGTSNGANGVGVYAQGGGTSSYALMLNNGAIGVNGAGVGTSTPVFIHQATNSNIACGFSQCTVIDHPLTNGDPNAILIVTHNFTPGGGSGLPDSHAVGVQYLSTSSKWAIYHLDLTAMFEGTAFNVLVVKP